MKLNFVLSYIKDNKRYGVAKQCSDSDNLYFKFKSWEEDYTAIYGNLESISIVSSKKNAEAIVRAWNNTYKNNGELQAI